jgi:precorrin-6A/cobalt-precorrin-6A reductase
VEPKDDELGWYREGGSWGDWRFVGLHLGSAEIAAQSPKEMPTARAQFGAGHVRTIPARRRANRVLAADRGPKRACAARFEPLSRREGATFCGTLDCVILILGGTAEARELAAGLDAQGVAVTSSLAGRVTRPRMPAGETRVGGFGGPDALACWILEHDVGAVIDATHPFAQRISASAAYASRVAGVALLRLERTGWSERPGDRWRWVDDLDEAATVIGESAVAHPRRRAAGRHAIAQRRSSAAAHPEIARPRPRAAVHPKTAPRASAAALRVLLTTGRQGLAAFAACDDAWFLVRCVDPPDPPLPRHHELLLDRGPYTLKGELALVDEHAIDLVVTKDSGGEHTRAKLDAARQRALPVIVVRRPPRPDDVETVTTVAEALAWALAAAGRCP